MELIEFVSHGQFLQVRNEYFSRTGLPLILTDIRGNRLYEDTFDSLEVQLELIGPQIRQADRIWLQSMVDNSDRFGEPCYCTTPLGLIAFSVPVTYMSQLLGGLVSGFVLLPEMADDFPGELKNALERFNIPCTPEQLTLARPMHKSQDEIRKAAAVLTRLSAQYHLNEMTPLPHRQSRHHRGVRVTKLMDFIKGQEYSLSRTIVDQQNEIFQRIRTGDYNGAREILNAFLGSIFLAGGIRTGLLKVRIMELAVIISRSAIEAGVDSERMLNLNYSTITRLQACDTFDELCQHTTRMMEDFIGIVSHAKLRKTNIHINTMREYLNRHFTEKISALDIADAAGVSVSRAQHLFRDETGMSFSDAIKRRRIDYAKYLLLNTDNSMAEIALAAGFFDQAHFTRHFKQLEDKTPLQFRNEKKKGPGSCNKPAPGTSTKP